MNDHQIDKLVRAAQRHAGNPVGSLDLGRGEQALLEEIMSSPYTPQLDPPSPVPEETLDIVRPQARPSRHRRALIGAAATVAFVAAVGGPTIVFRGGNDGSRHVKVAPGSYSALAQAVANSNPRLLVDDPAWKITHVDEFTADEGEIGFTNGNRELQVNWRAAKGYQGYYTDRLTVSKAEPFVVSGRKGALFTYSKDDFAVMLPPQGKNFLEIRGHGSNKQAFSAVMSKLKAVSVEKWLAAMPTSVVTPDKTVEIAREMLTGVPLPTGFDKTTLPTDGTNDYYQFGAAVVGKVTCAWLKEYESARTASDRTRMARVKTALNTSKQWKVLRRMNKEGDYPEVVWGLADQVAKGQAVPEYQQGLGCD